MRRTESSDIMGSVVTGTPFSPALGQDYLIVLCDLVSQCKGQQETILVTIHQLLVDTVVPIRVDEPSPFHHISMTLPALHQKSELASESKSYNCCCHEFAAFI